MPSSFGRTAATIFEAFCSGGRSSQGFRMANSTAEFDCAALVRKLRPLIEPTMSTPGVRLQDVAHLLGDRVGALQRGAVRPLDDDEEIALVLDRQEGRGACRVHSAVGADEPEREDRQQRPAQPDEAADQPRIAVRQPVEAGVEPAEQDERLVRRDGAGRRRSAPGSASAS